MKIIQLSDIHIGKPTELPFGIDVRQNFLNILEHIKIQRADLLILSGDFCLSGGKYKIYKWVKKHLNDLNIPIRVIAGNHDSSKKLAKVFNLNLQNNHLYYRFDLKQIPTFYLDSKSKTIPTSQIHWIKRELGKVRTKQVIFFVHHPLLIGGPPVMEKNHTLENKAEIKTILESYSDIQFYIFSGHYHYSKTYSFENIQQHITLSTYCNIKFSSKMEIIPKLIGYSIIKIHNDKISVEEVSFENGL